MKCYLIYGENGSYSDHCYYPLFVVNSEKLAEELSSALKKASDEYCQKSYDWLQDYEKNHPFPVRPAPLDPKDFPSKAQFKKAEKEFYNKYSNDYHQWMNARQEPYEKYLAEVLSNVQSYFPSGWTDKLSPWIKNSYDVVNYTELELFED